MLFPYQDPDLTFALSANSPSQEAEMDHDNPSLAPSTLLKGSVYRSDNGGSDSIWSKIGSGLSKVVGGVAQVVEGTLPYVGQAASAYANASLAASVANTKNTVGNWSDISLPNRSSGFPTRRSQSQNQPVTIRAQASTIGQKALNSIANYRSTPRLQPADGYSMTLPMPRAYPVMKNFTNKTVWFTANMQGEDIWVFTEIWAMTQRIDLFQIIWVLSKGLKRPGHMIHLR